MLICQVSEKQAPLVKLKLGQKKLGLKLSGRGFLPTSDKSVAITCTAVLPPPCPVRALATVPSNSASKLAKYIRLPYPDDEECPSGRLGSLPPATAKVKKL